MKLLRFSSRFLEMSLNDSLPNCLLGEGSSPMQGPSQTVSPGQELDRKAKKYEEERRQQMQKQAEQLRLEREALQQEIEKFKV